MVHFLDDTIHESMNGKNIKEAKDQSDIKKFENEMYDYMADCLPYLIRHMRNDDDGEEEIDPIFHTKSKKGAT